MSDIEQFASAIGAVSLRGGRRNNYFDLDGRFLAVKISRIDPPFWGLGKPVVDRLEDYLLVLLVPGQIGWVFSKAEVDVHTRGPWRLRVSDDNYKIHHRHLPTSNLFVGITGFFRKIRADES